MIGNIAPGASQFDTANYRLTNTELACQFRSPDTLRQPPFYLTNLDIREDGSTNRLAARIAVPVPPFVNHVSLILHAGTCEQMRRSYARRIVAPMAHIKRFVERTVVQLVRNTAGFLDASNRPHLPIAMLVGGTSPDPASTQIRETVGNGTVLIDLRPEPTLNGSDLVSQRHWRNGLSLPYAKPLASDIVHVAKAPSLNGSVTARLRTGTFGHIGSSSKGIGRAPGCFRSAGAFAYPDISRVIAPNEGIAA